jgi:transcriptional regulator with XRE-family HTH domain
MSRQELAEAVNAHVGATSGRRAHLDAGYIGKLERGEYRWPRADHRQGLRAVLGAATDAEIGLYNMRRSTSDELFLASDPTLASTQE